MDEFERLNRTEEYLRELDRELAGLPDSQRVEIVEEMRSRIQDEWEVTRGQTLSDFLALLARIGDPIAVARRERERLGIQAAPQTPPRLLEIAAVVATALFWPVGVVLAWLSPRWLVRDKAVATVIPIVGLLLLFTATAPVSVTVTEIPAGASTAVDAARQSDEAALALFGMLLVVFGVAGAPLFSAVYLALRMGPRPRHAAIVIPIAIAALLGITVIIALSHPLG